jgi:hypothetical protein
MRISKKHKTSLILFLIAIMFAGINVAYAATSGDLHFCQQPGVLRTMKIIGLIISVIKVLLPVIIIITGMITFAKVVISGKDEDFKESAKTMIKKVIAGIIIFLIPEMIHFVFVKVVNSNSTSNFTKCETCLNKPNSCSIPTSTPSSSK